MNPDLKKVIKYLNNQDWIFSKTYSKTAPHEYIVNNPNSSNRDVFEFVVRFIRENGKKERFWRKEFIYLYVDGYKYWTYGDPVNETIILNKAKI